MNTTKPFVFEYADKLLLFVPTYLYFVSILYYAGYWGTLGVDVYGYLELGDLLTGATRSMQLAFITALLSTTAAAGVAYTLTRFVARFRKSKSIVLPVILTYGFSAMIMSVYWAIYPTARLLFFGKEPEGVASIVTPFIGIPLFAYLLILFATSYVANNLSNWKNKEFAVDNPDDAHSLARSRRYVKWYGVFFMIISTPFISLSIGYFNAKSILTNTNFMYVRGVDYQVMREKPFSYLKYLGRVGDTYFLMYPDNSKTIVIDKDKLGAFALTSSQLKKP
ncbi:hypothetical protein [Hymenobacter rigui]|uniref:Uncharacterized protein n=1 Tax=Hymenobacter rigui TaxID=334424 RepID=A0A3R9V2E0_9BACT|nr:hypothetical protein [Hymenobacter rigui]RSK45211.1 hypothetical protein EI291_19050 [Hymenobacter rigui]